MPGKRHTREFTMTMPALRSGFAAATVAAFAGLATSAHAQLVTPPPAARPVVEYTPPPPPPPPEPARPAFDPTTVEFDPIYTVNDDGTITGPSRPPEIASIFANPLVPEDLKPVLDALLDDRRAKLDLVIAQNPRPAVRLASGEIETFDVGDPDTITAISDIARIFAPEDGAIRELQRQGVITDDMAAMSLHIWRNYTEAKIASFLELTRDSEDQNAMLNMQSRFMLNSTMEEPLQAFDRVARRALEQLGTPGAAAVLNADPAEFRAEAAEFLAAMDDETLSETLLAGVR